MAATFRLWAPRALGVLVSALALFALDAFAGGRGPAALPEFFIHLVPALILLAVVAASWRHPWVGALPSSGWQFSTRCRFAVGPTGYS